MPNHDRRKAEIPNLNDLFANLPSEVDDNYTYILMNIVLDNDLPSRESDVKSYLESPTATHRFAAFYALLIICREYNNHSKYNAYVEKYAKEFAEYKLYSIIQSTYYRNNGILGDKEGYKRAIKFAEQACDALPTNLAVKHHYAELIALVIEENCEVESCMIDKAIERLDDVIIAHSKHAKYYCTQGRLIAASGDYHRAISCIKKALDLETVVDKDSMIRIGQYNYYLLQIKMMMENQQVDAKIGRFNSSFQVIEQNLDSIKTQYLEYLAFFSSVLAFILITVNIVSKIEDFNKCAGIILMFAGALVIVFGIFRMLLHFSSRENLGIIKFLFVYGIGVLFIIVGYLVGNHAFLYS